MLAVPLFQPVGPMLTFLSLVHTPNADSGHSFGGGSSKCLQLAQTL